MISHDLNNKINSIELSYLFAKNLDHGVNKTGNWMLFEPSKFIYSFFALNVVYEINWLSTFRRKNFWDQRGKTHTKLYFLIEFLYKHSSFFDFQSEYHNYGSLNLLIENSKKIKRDPNIDQINNCEKLSVIDTFFNNYINSINNLKEDRFGVEDHYNLLAFTYQIRNNIFHGLKTVGMMTIREQRDRLIDYTNIVLLTLEMFFNILEKHFEYVRIHKDALDENVF